jgi:TPR repeat protein
MKVRSYFLLIIVSIAPLCSFAGQMNLASLQTQAAQGNAQAELDLGRAYHLGKGVPQDFTKAAELYRQAGAQGNAKAMYNLGYMYDHAQGVTKDSAMAAQWFQKSADLGLAAGQLQIGLAYFSGDDGLKQDYVAAGKWLTLVVNQPNAPQQVPLAANALGSLYEHGEGVPMNAQQMIFWYTKGAEMGNAKAQFNLGRVYDEGFYVKRDRVRAYKWVKLSAFQGEPMATHFLTEYLAAKEFTPEEMAEADREIRKYQVAHHLATDSTVTLALDPNVPPTAPSRNAAPSADTVVIGARPAPATNAAPTAIAQPH